MSKMILEQGKQYTANLGLGPIDRLAGNDTIAERFRGVGFT